jgi:hypothetical protein
MRAMLLLVLAGCPTIDLGETPVTPPLCRPSLDTLKKPGGVWDVAVNPSDPQKSCVAMAGCHAQATGRSALRLIPMPQSDADWAQNLDEIAQFLDCASPSESLFVTKPEAGVESHLGGDLWENCATCEPMATVVKWIAAH